MDPNTKQQEAATPAMTKRKEDQLTGKDGIEGNTVIVLG